MTPSRGVLYCEILFEKEKIVELDAKRVKNIGNRNATWLSNGAVRVAVEDRGAMVPELSYKHVDGYLNAHWVPQFRGNSGRPFSKSAHGGFWGANILYGIAGNFPCIPSFGQPCRAYGVKFETHGPTANELWRFERSGVLPGRAAFSISTLRGFKPRDLSYRKYDIVLPDHPVHYSVIKVKNSGGAGYRVNAAWHNTLSAPFLDSSCLIDLSAREYATAPSPGEFDSTGHLAPGAQFDNLERAPLRNGRKINARIVPGMIGYTDFITGPVPKKARLGWSSVVNPNLGAVYLCFFKGPAADAPSDIVLTFNDLWLQYGGRRFTPWAQAPGGTDLTFCLGTENAVGAYANGLAYSLEHPELLGAPTTVEIQAGEERTLSYGSLVAEYDRDKLSGGVEQVEIDRSSRIAVQGKKATGSGAQTFKADAEFTEIAKIVQELG